jgi:aspartate-semialdehyde dehydrogenase
MIKSDKVVSSIEGGLVIVLGAVVRGYAKKLRMDPNVPSIPDYVNPETVANQVKTNEKNAV